MTNPSHGKSSQYYQFARPEVQALVPMEARRILDVGCGGGALGAALKERQECEVWGVEYVPEVARDASSVLDRVVVGRLEDSNVVDEIPEGYFEAIIFADVLEHLREPELLLARLKRCLSPDGIVVVSIPNVRHWSVLKGLLEGHWNYEDAGILDRTHLRFFTGSSLVTMFQEAGYEIGNVSGMALADCQLPPGLAEALREFDIDTRTLAQESQVYQYLATASPARQSSHSPLTDLPAVPHQRHRKPVASLVMLTCNQLDFTKQCLDSLFEHTSTPYELIVVDNGSTDGTLEYLGGLIRSRSDIKVIANPANLGFGAGNNQGIAAAQGEFIGILNNDLILTAGWLERMISQANHSDRVGVVGPRSNVVSGPQELATLDYGDLAQMHRAAGELAAEQSGQGFSYPRVVGFCMLVKRGVIDAIGGFDERFGRANFEDDDFCWRVNTAGFECRVADDVFIHHFGSRTFLGEQIDYKACMQLAWDWFVQKWSLDPELPVGSDYPITLREFQPGIHFSELPDASILPLRGWVESMPTAAEMADRYSAFGERLYGRGDSEEALRFFDTALSWDDGCAEALNNMGVIAFHDDRLAEAIGTLRHALSRDPGNKNTIWNLISIYLQSGMKDQAKELLSDFVRLDEDNVEAAELLKSL